jgi:hypothetical protein
MMLENTPDDPFGNMFDSTPHKKPLTLEEQADADRNGGDLDPIKARVFLPGDTSLLLPRDWLYQRIYIRGFVTGTFAPGGGAKTQKVLKEMVEMACGFNLDTRDPFKRGSLNVWYINVEDDDAEIIRRLGAICKHYRITAEDLGGRLRFDTDRMGRYVLVEGGQNIAVKQIRIDQLLNEIDRTKTDVLVIDPLVGIHTVTENLSDQMNQVMRQLRHIADIGHCGVHVLHHVRKGTNGEVNADDGRGSGAIKDACRAIRTIAPISEKEAERFSIPTETRLFYLYENPSGKPNLAPPASERHYIHMIGVGLGNGNDLNDEDVVGVPTVWSPPGVFEGTTMLECQQAWSLIETSNPEDCKVSKQAAGWIGNVIAKGLGLDATDQSARTKIDGIIAAWEKAKILIKQTGKKSSGNYGTFPYFILDKTKLTGGGHDENENYL